MAEETSRIQLEIVTPKGRALSVVADEVTAPSVAGEFGVLPGHLPLLAALRTGIVSYKDKGNTVRVAVGAGFAEAGPHKVVILTDEYIEKDKIDPVLVRKELAEVQSELAKIETKALAAPTGRAGDAESVEAEHDNLARKALIAKENWLAAQVELYGDPPPAIMRPFETFGPPPPPDDGDVALPGPTDKAG
jgi:F-type H+-transporting ATPase subunit epsilon